MKQPMKLSPSEFATVVWHWTLPVGQSLDDVLDPAYWQHVTAQLRPGHEIKIASEDRTIWAHLFVRDVAKMEATVAVLHSVTLGEDVDQGEDSDTFVKWRSPQSKYGVFRKSDQECLQDKFETKEAALTWAAQRESGLAA